MNLTEEQQELGDKLELISFSFFKPEGWTSERIALAISQYKMFLMLVNENQDQPIVPTMDIDAVWHEHMKQPCYHSDIKNTVGSFVRHHEDFLKLRPVIHSEACRKTKNLWFKTFNVELNNPKFGHCGAFVLCPSVDVGKY